MSAERIPTIEKPRIIIDQKPQIPWDDFVIFEKAHKDVDHADNRTFDQDTVIFSQKKHSPSEPDKPLPPIRYKAF